MNYPDGSKIPDQLPPSYRPASTYNPPSGDPKTIGEKCRNCRHFDIGYCNWHQAPVRDYYYCLDWARIERKQK